MKTTQTPGAASLRAPAAARRRWSPLTTSFSLLSALSLLAGFGAVAARGSTPAKSTESFLNLLGVNTHLDGNSGWNTNATQVGQQMAYIGVRLERDWPHGATATGAAFHTAQLQNPLGRLWMSIGDASPAGQRSALTDCETVFNNYGLGLVYAMGGPNEEDTPYPQGLGARLPDSALVQQSLYNWAHSRGIKVGQMEFGAGWTATNSWQGDYNPANPGINYTVPGNGDQHYTAGDADLGGAHTYLVNKTTTPAVRLASLRALALLTTPGAPVATTEWGAYTYSGLTNSVFGQYMVMGAFDAANASDAAYIIYGLQDGAIEGTYGFYTSAAVANPVSTYFHSLTTVLQCANAGLRYAPGQAATFIPGALNVSYSNTTTVSHCLLQKPTGEYVVAAYSEQLMNGAQASAADTINFGQTFGTVKVYDVQTGTTPIATLSNVSSYALTLNPSDTYLIVLSNGGQTIVKDNADASGITIAGAWTTGGGVTGYYGPDYIYAGPGGGASVTFTPPISVTGSYDVYARWTTNANRATNAHITVNHASGASGYTVNQQLNNGVWMLIGTFAFYAGTAGNVVISNTSANGMVVADAVEFVQQ